MWIYYFLFDKKTVYLKYSSYYAASPQIGEWTLYESQAPDIFTLSNFTNMSNIIQINNDYYLGENSPLDISLYKGWWGIESNQNTHWRWSGANNDIPSIKLTNNGDKELYIDLKLNESPLNPENKLFVVLDNQQIRNCPSTYCEITNLSLSPGSHILQFESSLPPQSPGSGDPRYLGYMFTNIMISKSTVG